MYEKSEREIYLMGKVPPDAWQVVTTVVGLTQYGDIHATLDDALAEYAVLHRTAALLPENYDSINIVPLWNTAWHEGVA